MSKHRKRDHTNMTSSELKALSADLFTVLLCPFFWKQTQWLDFKAHVKGLAKTLLDYSDYLHQSSKRMKEHHLAVLPSRQLATNLTISFLPVTELRPLKPDSLNTKLSSIKYVDVNDFCPTEAHKKHQKLMEGLSVPCCLLTYSAGAW